MLLSRSSNPACCECFVKIKNSTLRDGFSALPWPFVSHARIATSSSTSSFSSCFFFLPFFFLLSSFLFLSSTYPRRNQWDSIEISLSKRSTDLFPIIGNLLVRTWNVVGSFEFVRRVFFFPLTVIDSSTVKWSAPFRRKRTSRSKKTP